MTNRLVAVIGGSGVGKTTLVNHLESVFESRLRRIITHTTRPKRYGEAHGTDYYFVSKSSFNDLVKGDSLVEHTVFNGENYGTCLREFIPLFKNEVRVAVVDVDGAKWYKKIGAKIVYIWGKNRVEDKYEDDYNVARHMADTLNLAKIKQDGLDLDATILNDDLNSAKNQIENHIKKWFFSACE